MSAWFELLGSAVAFGVQLLLLVTALVCVILTILVPASLGAEKRFEARLEYFMFTTGAAVLWAFTMFAPR